MDLPCVKCGEPWDNDSLHEEASESDRTYTAVARDFAIRGCAALETAFGPSTCVPNRSLRTEVASAMFDLMGDDTDGVASMMSDFEYMGMLD